MNKNNLLVIIAAAGIGERFGKHLPKQYEKINGNTILEMAVKPFVDSIYVTKIIIAVADNDEHIKDQNFYNLEKIEYVVGGSSRQESIYNALDAASDQYEFVITHDAARPNIDEDVIVKLYEDIIKSLSLIHI